MYTKFSFKIYENRLIYQIQVDELAPRASSSQLQLDYSTRSLVELLLLTVTETPSANAASGGASSVTVGGQSNAILQVIDFNR